MVIKSNPEQDEKMLNLFLIYFMKELSIAIIAVMKDVEGVAKNMTV